VSSELEADDALREIFREILGLPRDDIMFACFPLEEEAVRAEVARVLRISLDDPNQDYFLEHEE
jgi:hypothetical protein